MHLAKGNLGFGGDIAFLAYTSERQKVFAKEIRKRGTFLATRFSRESFCVHPVQRGGGEREGKSPPLHYCHFSSFFHPKASSLSQGFICFSENDLFSSLLLSPRSETANNMDGGERKERGEREEREKGFWAIQVFFTCGVL